MSDSESSWVKPLVIIGMPIILVGGAIAWLFWNKHRNACEASYEKGNEVNTIITKEFIILKDQYKGLANENKDITEKYNAIINKFENLQGKGREAVKELKDILNRIEEEGEKDYRISKDDKVQYKKLGTYIVHLFYELNFLKEETVRVGIAKT